MQTQDAAQQEPITGAALIESAGVSWQEALTHRFVREVLTDTLETEDFCRYVKVEWQFIDTAARSLGRAIHLAPTLEDRRVLAAGLFSLTTEQVGYFYEAAEKLGVSLDESIPPPAARAAAHLHDYVLRLSNADDYLALVASMYASERYYLEWCGRAAGATISDPHIEEWVLLHKAPAFVQHASWLESKLAELIPGVSTSEFARASSAFTATIEAEIVFHDAVYL